MAAPCATASPAPCLSVWVVGNPTSGGKRGAVVLRRLAELFQQTYGADAVQETCSSRFLLLTFPAHTRTAATATTPSTATSASAEVQDDAFSSLVSLDTIWATGAAPSTAVAGSTLPITPPSPPQCASPPPSSPSPTSVAVTVRAMFIHTDHSGHAKTVTNALSRLILRARFADQALKQQQQQQQQQRQRGEPRSNGATPSAADGLAPCSSRAQHLIVVVGGDGTLSEAVNGLCEGTLAGYQHFSSALQGCTSAASTEADGGAKRSSHAHIEQEAAVLTRLLPAVLYTPGGTGADFAKLGLCCPTPEAALRAVRDGVVRLLFPRLHRQSAGHDDAADMQTRSAPACYACPVDIGRIEFLCTGTRRYFINIASIGMSCDVIQRGERFKRSKLVSKLGGTLLFALSAFISLLLMTPKPLYLCKLPPRTTRMAATAGEATEKPDSHDVGRAGNRANTPCGSTKKRHLNAAVSGDSLLSLPAFAPLGEQLQRLQAELSLRTVHEAAAKPLSRAASVHLFSSLHGDSVYAANSGDSAYQCHADTAMPPPHAKVVQCTTATSMDNIRRLLDVNETELRALRNRQAHQLERMLSTASPVDIVAGKRKQTHVIERDRGMHRAHNGTNGEHHNAAPSHVDGPTAKGSRGSWVNNDDDNDDDDDLSSLTWVELPSSMVAFANGRWYGGGMHVAPHANPTDAMLSCTNWVATVLPFVSGVLSLYTGRHLRWSSTRAFEGERFLVCNTPPHSIDSAVEPLYMEADGEVLEPVPAIVELAGKITFIVPLSSHLCLGDPAPGTTRARLDATHAAAAALEGSNFTSDSGSPFASQLFFTDKASHPDTIGAQVRRSVSGLGVLWRRCWSHVRRWVGHDECQRRGEEKDGSEVESSTANDTVGATRRVRDNNADDIV